MNYESIILPVLIVLLFAYKFQKNRKIKKELPALLASGAQIIDVRSIREFEASHNPASKNIPLDQISAAAESLDKEKTYILCCASGARSAAALGVLKSKGFKNLINAGSWTSTLIK